MGPRLNWEYEDDQAWVTLPVLGLLRVYRRNKGKWVWQCHSQTGTCESKVEAQYACEDAAYQYAKDLNDALGTI